MSEREQAWHTLEAEAALSGLESRPDGLTTAEVQARLARHGPNRITTAARRSALARLLAQFHNVLIYVLIAAAGVTALLGHWVDTGVIVGVVVINAIIGFLQEGKAEAALDAIRDMLSPRATVRREGRSTTVDATELVPGDVVLLAPGDKVPADLRLFRARDLQIDESVLTGESVAVEKTTEAVADDAALGDRRGMAYSGTLVTYGQASGVVVATGDATEIGRISAMLEEVETLQTPLLRQVAAFGRVLSATILAVAGIAFAFGTLVREYALTEMFLAAVSLAVAAIPEGLPAIMTITLAIGVQAMARRNAIVRRLPAVETLGSVSVIGSDKTGTLTRNEMTAQEVVTAQRRYHVTGAGYEPRGAFRLDGDEVEPAGDDILLELGRAGLLCNDASIFEIDGQWRLAGDPTEGALVTLAHKMGLDSARENEARPRDDVIPFDSSHKLMATLHHDHAGHAFIYLKGAPEAVLERCSHVRVDGDERPLNHAEWMEHMETLGREGQRVLAIAFAPAADHRHDLRFEDIEGGLTLLGLVGIIDPPREEAIRAVAECRRAGIRVKMITGDHAITAAAIGAQMGIGDGERVLTGAELDRMDDATLHDEVDRVDIFARTSPEHKLRLVRAIQARGQVAAMTGDGVNDAPALKQADVGVAMGQNGTEVAKEAAEMVLADDNFASIAAAVREGRTVYDNLKKAILFILPTNGGQALILLAAIALGYTLPITPVQILWVNMVTAVTLALALAFEPSEPGVMDRPPRDAREPLLSGFLIWRIGMVSALMLAAAGGVFIWQQAVDAGIEVARTAAVNTLVVLEIFYLFNARYITNSSIGRHGLAGNRAVWIAVGALIVLQALFTWAPPLQLLFGTAPPAAAVWLAIVAAGVALFLVVEAEKALQRARGRHS
ncbi:cation-transporting P-type ATPase [Thiohalospira sp.]|uniref:cation-transporting P-type ATPase n=1 Tax=Thiohalospira sp. TaxID=3080549 RepID=UPI0039815FCD